MTGRNHSTSFCVLIAGLIAVMACAASQAQSSKPINGNGKAENRGEFYSGYRDWKPVNKEPKAIVARAMAACAPAVRVGPPLDPHEGGFINIYINQIGRDGYLDKKAPAFAAGSVIVKEKLKKKDGKGPIELGVMIKREAGFAPDSGDWQFLFVDQKGTVSDGQGLQKSCVACHRLHAKEDFVFRKLSQEVSSDRGNEESTANSAERNGNVRGQVPREPEPSKKDESLTALYEWLPADCPTMIFVRPPGGRLPKPDGWLDEKDADAKETSNSGALLHAPFAALYGLPIDAALSRFKARKIKVVAAGAKDFRMVKKGPVGVSSCKGCVIFMFDEDLEKSGPAFLSELQEGGGKRLDIDGQAVIKSSGGMNDEPNGDVFTSHPAGRVLAFTNDLDLMKQCLRKVKENPQLKASRPESPPWFAKYVDPKASSTALRVEEHDMRVNYKFVVNWKSESPAAVEIIWLSNHILLPADYPEKIRKRWTLPPRDVMPAVAKVEKGNIWLQFELKDKDEWADVVLLILINLGFSTTF